MRQIPNRPSSGIEPECQCVLDEPFWVRICRVYGIVDAHYAGKFNKAIT